MESKIELQKNAAVLTADGQQVGSLKMVVVNPDSMVLNAIVVRMGSNKHEEKVVPIKLVAEANEDQIVLKEKTGPMENFPLYEAEYSMNAKKYTDQIPPVEIEPFSPEPPNVEIPSTQTGANKGVFAHIKRNIPEGTVAVGENAEIISREGIHVGNVERIVADSSDERVTHLMTSYGVFVKKKRLVPIHWVTMMGRELIHLGVKKEVFEELDDKPRTE